MEHNEIIKIPKLKRLFDVIFSLFFVIIFSPLFVLIMVLILVEHIIMGQVLAPLFYTETRISQGDTFPLIKFNIFNPQVIAKMKADGKFIATKQVEKNDQSLIWTGRVLKSIYLDELPQLLNILIGHISVVGPRPVNLHIYQNSISRGIYNKKVIKAGLTGNFQSQKGLTKKTDVELDGEYIEYCRLNPAWKIVLFDLKILLRTI